MQNSFIIGILHVHIIAKTDMKQKLNTTSKLTCETEIRKKTKCPVKSCGKSLYNLPRQMRAIHKWTDNEAKNMKWLYGLRKQYKFKISTKTVQRRSLYHKQCPIYGCRSVVINLSRHIQKSHGISRFTNMYKTLLKEAKTIDARSKKHE